MAIAFVQQGSNTTAAAATVTVTLGQNTTAGNCLVVCTALGNSSQQQTVSSVTLGGAAGNFAQLAAVGNLVTGAEQLAAWADPNCAGGQTAVAVTWSGGLAVMVYVFEFSGIVASSPLDQSVTFDSGGGSNSTFSVTTGTLAQATEVAVGCAYGYNQTVTGPNSPWVNEATITSGPRDLQASYNIVNATTAVTYSGSFGASTFNGQILVTLKGTVSAGPAGTVEPWTTVPVPRRRAYVRGSPPFTGFVAVPAPAQQPRTLPRRVPARAVTVIRPPQPTVTYVAVPAPLQLPRFSRRVPARAYVRFTPVTTTNTHAAAAVGQVQGDQSGRSMFKRWLQYADI